MVARGVLAFRPSWQCSGGAGRSGIPHLAAGVSLNCSASGKRKRNFLEGHAAWLNVLASFREEKCRASARLWFMPVAPGALDSTENLGEALCSGKLSYFRGHHRGLLDARAKLPGVESGRVCHFF